MVLRAVVGFAFAGLYGVIDGWVQGKADNEHRGRLGGAYQFVHFTAVACGQMLLPLSDPMGFQLFIGSASCSPRRSSRLRAPDRAPALPETARLELGWLFRNAQVSAVACLGVGAANGSFWSLAPVFGASSGMTPATSPPSSRHDHGLRGGVIPIGRYSDRTDRRWSWRR